MHSWRAMLLPHLEHADLGDKIDFTALATDAVNQKAFQKPVTAYACPTGASPTANMVFSARHDLWPEVPHPLSENQKVWMVRSDYDAMLGVRVEPDYPHTADEYDWTGHSYIRWGIWGWPRFDKVRHTLLRSYRLGKLSDVTDGLSNTIAVVERGGKPVELENGQPRIFEGRIVEYPVQAGWSASNTPQWSLNQVDVGVNESNSRGIYSLNRGGANVAMADGSVRFLSASTDYQELVKLFTR